MKKEVPSSVVDGLKDVVRSGGLQHFAQHPNLGFYVAAASPCVYVFSNPRWSADAQRVFLRHLYTSALVDTQRRSVSVAMYSVNTLSQSEDDDDTMGLEVLQSKDFPLNCSLCRLVDLDGVREYPRQSPVAQKSQTKLANGGARNVLEMLTTNTIPVLGMSFAGADLEDGATRYSMSSEESLGSPTTPAILSPVAAAASLVNSIISPTLRPHSRESGGAPGIDLKGSQDKKLTTKVFQNLARQLRGPDCFFNTADAWNRHRSVNVSADSRTPLLLKLDSFLMKHEATWLSFHHAVVLIDTFMAKCTQVLPKEHLMLLSVAATVVACKYVEVSPPQLVELCESRFDYNQVVRAEIHLLETLGFNISRPVLPELTSLMLDVLGLANTGPVAAMLQLMVDVSILSTSFPYNTKQVDPVTYAVALVEFSVKAVHLFQLQPEMALHPSTDRVPRAPETVLHKLCAFAGVQPSAVADDISLLVDLHARCRNVLPDSLRQRYHDSRRYDVATIATPPMESFL